MGCYNPLDAYRSEHKTDNGKSQIVFKRKDGYAHLQLPCGKCIGCRLEYARQWALRCHCESQMHPPEHQHFITFSYAPEHLPKDLSVTRGPKSDFTRFLKRLRYYYEGFQIQFLQCAEYGEESNRPHHHSIMWGFPIDDMVVYSKNRLGQELFTSETINQIWKKGYCIIGKVTLESANYVARYITKKFKGDLGEVDPGTGLKPYERYNSQTGEIHTVLPEYLTASRNPSIGKTYHEQFSDDYIHDDTIIVDGKRMFIPDYFTYLVEKESRELYEKIKKRRKLAAKKHTKNKSRDRLRVRGQFKTKQIQHFKRDSI